MKIIESRLGPRRIEDWDANMISLQLRQVLQDLRASLIDDLIQVGNLENYLFAKLRLSATPQELRNLTLRLKSLRNSGLDIENYRAILTVVAQRDSVYIDTAFCYAEIDHIIRSALQPDILNHMSTYSFDSIDLLQSVRRGLIAKVLTEEGLKDYAYNSYGTKLNDHAKVHYLLDELRHYFFNARTDYDSMLTNFKRKSVENISDACKEAFDQEMETLLDRHFMNKV